MGRIEVETTSLTDAARTLWSVAGVATSVRGGFDAATHGVGAACGDGEPGGAFDGLVSSWSVALAGLSDALTSFERNTETAAILYQHADRSAMPSTPPPPPPAPTHQDSPLDPFLAHPPVQA